MSLSAKDTSASSRIPALLALAGFLLNFTAYYPGFMSPDSFDIYEQSITQQYRDWHPPLMAFLWHLLNNIYQGPQVMLALQLALLWGSFYVLATGPLSSPASRIGLFIGVLFAPFIQNFAGYIIKDVSMALAWLLSFSLIARACYQRRRMHGTEAFFAFLLIVFGALIRINALPGALPLIYFWFRNVMGPSGKRRAVFSVAALSLLLVIACQVLLNSMLKPQKQYPEYKLYLHDLSGIYVATGKNYFPSFITQHPGFDTAYLKKHYTTATIDNLYWNEEKQFSFPLLQEKNKEEVQQAWANSIKHNFGSYLKNRWDGFLYFLRFKKRSWLVVQHAEVSPNSYGLTFRKNVLSHLFLKVTKLQSALPYMKPWFWFVLNGVVLLACFYMVNGIAKRAVLVLSLSSLCYLLPQFFIFQVDTDFRYFYWNCLSLFICVFLLIKDRQEKKRNLKDL